MSTIASKTRNDPQRTTQIARGLAVPVGRVTPCAPTDRTTQRRARSDAPYLVPRKFLLSGIAVILCATALGQPVRFVPGQILVKPKMHLSESGLGQRLEIGRAHV